MTAMLCRDVDKLQEKARLIMYKTGYKDCKNTRGPAPDMSAQWDIHWLETFFILEFLRWLCPERR